APVWQWYTSSMAQDYAGLGAPPANSYSGGLGAGTLDFAPPVAGVLSSQPSGATTILIKCQNSSGDGYLWTGSTCPSTGCSYVGVPNQGTAGFTYSTQQPGTSAWYGCSGGNIVVYQFTTCNAGYTQMSLGYAYNGAPNNAPVDFVFPETVSTITAAPS